MIEGIGVDVVEIGRMQKTIEAWGNTFLGKVFTDAEISYAGSKKHPVQHIAARFAVKEAVAKALATGWNGGFRWKDVEVINDVSGRPSVNVSGNVRKLLRSARILISISHSESIVVACAVIEKPD